MKTNPSGSLKAKSQPSRSFLVGMLLLVALYASIMSRDITEPFYGLHSWAQAHLSWLARSHVNYGLQYTNGLYTWAVGMPPPESPAHYLDHPQLPSLLNAVSLYVFGVNDWAQRLGTLLVSILSLILLLAFLRRLYDETTSLLAGFIYVMLPITGYFYWIGTWLFPVTLIAFWCYITLIDGFGEKSEPRPIHLTGLGVSLFLMVQLNWVGFMYAAAIGTHYVIWSLWKKRFPDIKLFLILLLTPLISLALVMTILIAARDWNYQQMIDLFMWRSTPTDDAFRTLPAWWENFFLKLRTNFTLLVLVLAGAYFLEALIHFGWKRSVRIAGKSNTTSSDSIEENINARGFKFIWIFLVPGVLYVAVFTEAMWVHQFKYSYFSLFIAIAAALALLRLRDLLTTSGLVIANMAAAVSLIVIFVFCIVGLNAYHDIEWYPPKKIEMFENLSHRLRPDQSLLSYESYVVSENPAKGSFYRPEIAWYLDREIVVARSLPEIQKYSASGKFPYYLMANTKSPLFLEMKKIYSYEYIQGRHSKPGKVGMPSYHIFDLRSEKK
ncbi:ArnT family glycosyltransferase [Pseudomonadota bacterium]